MGKIIKDLPDEIDPVVLIKEKKMVCPWCHHYCKDGHYFSWKREKRDIHGKYHKILKFKNKYLWERYPIIECSQCGCKYDTGWYPIDHEMFEINIEDEEKGWDQFL